LFFAGTGFHRPSECHEIQDTRFMEIAGVTASPGVVSGAGVDLWLQKPKPRIAVLSPERSPRRR
jgi:hypothetical protein